MEEIRLEAASNKKILVENFNSDLIKLKLSLQGSIHLFDNVLDEFKEKFHHNIAQIEEIHNFGTMFEAEIKRFKRDKSDNERISEYILERLK